MDDLGYSFQDDTVQTKFYKMTTKFTFSDEQEIAVKFMNFDKFATKIVDLDIVDKFEQHLNATVTKRFHTENSNEEQGKKRLLRSFPIDYKLKIIDQAKINGNRKTGRENKLDESVVRNWQKLELQLRNLDSKSKNIAHKGNTIEKKRFRLHGGGAKVKFPDLEKDLLDWFQDRRDKQLRLTRKSIRKHANSLAAQKGLVEFNGSEGWLTGWLSRHGLSFRSSTHIAQGLPKDLLPKVNFDFKNEFLDLFGSSETTTNSVVYGIFVF